MSFPNIIDLCMDDVALMKQAREDIPLPEAAVETQYGLSPSRAILQRLSDLQREYEEAKSISIKIIIAKKKYKTFKKPALEFMNLLLGLLLSVFV